MSVIVRVRVLRGVPESVQLARRFVRRVAEEARFPAVDDVTLCASELVTNAVTHSLSGTGGGRVRLQVVVALGAWLRLECRDNGPAGPSARVPAQLPASPESEDGRGLFLVSQLATSWHGDGHGLYWCQFTWQDQDDDLAPVSAAPDQGSLFDLLAE